MKELSNWIDSMLPKKNDFHIREIIHGTSIAFIYRVAGALLALSFQVALARSLGAEQAGRYILSISCVLFLTVLGRLGLDTIAVREIAAHASVNEWRSVRSIRRKTLGVVLPVTVFLAVCLFTISDWMAVSVFKDPALQLPLKVMAFGAPFWALAALQSEMLRGLKKVGQYLFIQSIMLPTVSLLGVFLLGTKFGLEGQSLFYVLATMLSMMVAWGLWHFDVSQREQTGGDDASLNKILKSSLSMLWVAVAVYINSWIGTIILGTQGDPAQVAIYNAASRLALAPSFLLISVNSILGPKLSAIYKSGSMVDLQRVTAQTTRMLFFLVLPLLAAFLVFPKLILSVFGTEFESAHLVLRILVVGQMTSFMTGFAGQLLIMTGHEKDVRNVTTVSVIFNIILSLILISFFKTFGAACAMTIVTVLTQGLLIYFVNKRLKISVHILSK